MQMEIFFFPENKKKKMNEDEVLVIDMPSFKSTKMRNQLNKPPYFSCFASLMKMNRIFFFLLISSSSSSSIAWNWKIKKKITCSMPQNGMEYDSEINNTIVKLCDCVCFSVKWYLIFLAIDSPLNKSRFWQSDCYSNANGERSFSMRIKIVIFVFFSSWFYSLEILVKCQCDASGDNKNKQCIQSENKFYKTNKSAVWIFFFVHKILELGKIEKQKGFFSIFFSSFLLKNKSVFN